MDGLPTPSRLYRVYWMGRYLERLDLTARALSAAVGELAEAGRDSPLARLAASLGLEYRGPGEFLQAILYNEELASSLLHAAKMVRLNAQGLGVERVIREANLLVLTAENRIDTRNPRQVRAHLDAVISAAARLGKVMEEELTEPPTPPEQVLREQLLHQQQ